MPLFDKYGEQDSTFVRVGDSAFVGMDYRTAPDKLGEGVYSYGENVRVRTKEVCTRPGNPYINWFYPDNWPYDVEYSNGGVELTGTWYASGSNAAVVINSGTTSGIPYSSEYEYLRFGSGSGPAVVLKATGEETGGTIPVDPQFVANGYDVVAETFVWCKFRPGEEYDEEYNNGTDLTRGVIADSGQTVVTCGQFKDPDSNDYAVIVTDTSTWFGREHNRPFEVTVPDGVDDNAYLLQCFDKLLLFRGTGQSVLEYSTATGIWDSITASSSGDFTRVIPNADRATFFQNRVWVHVDDRIYISDIGVYTRYYWLENEVRINTGDNDKIVALFPYGKYAMLVFKENSIHLLDNLYGDITQNMRVRQISSRIGCGAAETVVNLGNRVWFCDKAGNVWDISQVDEERMELSGEPVSWPMKPFWDEKGARNVSTWFAAYYDSYYFLFIDTENATWINSRPRLHPGYPDYDNLNRVAVYDTINEAWISLDWDASLNAIGKPLLLDYLGKQRLMVVDQATGHLRVIGYGETDGTRGLAAGDTPTYNLASGEPWTEFMTRGYLGDVGVEQSFSQVKIQLKRQDNSFYVTGVVDGVNETEVIIHQNRADSDRVTYLNSNESVGFSTWNPNNAAGDFDNPYRADYTIYPSASTGIKLGSDGISTGEYQNYKFTQRINELGNYMQVKVVGDAGRMKVKNVSVAVRKNMNLQGERV